MWDSFKTLLAELTAISEDALHVHIGLIVYFGAWFVFRQRAPGLLPWLVVLGLELANEAVDLLYWQGEPGAAKWTGSMGDLLNTMLWPTVLTMLFRARAKSRSRPVVGNLKQLSEGSGG